MEENLVELSTPTIRYNDQRRIRIEYKHTTLHSLHVDKIDVGFIATDNNKTITTYHRHKCWQHGITYLGISSSPKIKCYLQNIILWALRYADAYAET